MKQITSGKTCDNVWQCDAHQKRAGIPVPESKCNKLCTRLTRLVHVSECMNHFRGVKQQSKSKARDLVTMHQWLSGVYKIIKAQHGTPLKNWHGTHIMKASGLVQTFFFDKWDASRAFSSFHRSRFLRRNLKWIPWRGMREATSGTSAFWKL